MHNHMITCVPSFLFIFEFYFLYIYVFIRKFLTSKRRTGNFGREGGDMQERSPARIKLATLLLCDACANIMANKGTHCLQFCIGFFFNTAH